MNKQDFINRLRAALNGNVSPDIVTENVNYYSHYIDAEIAGGKREEEVLRMLGDPRLIAKTIIDTNSRSGQSVYPETERVENEKSTQLRVSRLPGWLWSIISILIIVAVISVVLSVISFLAPVIITVLVVLFLVKLFRDWLN